MKKQILFVDDERPVLDAIRRMLRTRRDVWEMAFFDHPEAAWERLREGRFDAVVTDLGMPELNGLQLLQRIRRTESTRDLPVVVMTGLAERKLKREALNLEADDLLNKPIQAEDLLARLSSALRLKTYRDQQQDFDDRLERAVEKRTEELLHSRLDVIWRLAKAAEHRDNETANHVIRVGCTSRAIAETMGMNRHFTETLFLAAPLHDIGKIGIPDAILMKRGPLGPGQWATMKQHCVIGERILREESKVQGAYFQWRGIGSRAAAGEFDSPFLDTAASIALMHHEKWNGTGYPQELAGEEIPLEARIVAIADVFDALTSHRPYKDPYPEDMALQIVRDGAGTHFDPEVYAAFMKSLEEIRSIRRRFADGVNTPPETEFVPEEEDLVLQ